MSQVIRLQPGGTTEPRVGSLTIDGKKYDATPEFIQALSSHLHGYGSMSAPLAGLTAALQNGEDVVYDSVGNTITGMSGKWAGISDKQDRKRDAGTSEWRKRWQATFDTDAHKFRNAVKLLSGFTYNPNSNTEDTSNLKDIYGNTDWFDYLTDDEGNQTWSENSSKNAGLMQRLDDVSEYLRDPEAGKKAYRLASQYTPQHIAALQKLYSENQDRWADTLAQVKDRVKNGTYTDADIAFLKNFFIEKPTDSDQAKKQAEAKQQKEERTAWTNAGWGDRYDTLSPKFQLNDDGSLSLRGGMSWDWNLGDLNGSNIWFNDDFYDSAYGSNGDLDVFRDLTLYGNRLYQLNNGTLARILNASGGFNERAASGDWDGANSIIRYRFTDGARENPSRLKEDEYSKFFEDNPSYIFQNLTGLRSTFGMEDEDQIVQYYDLKDNTTNGAYRIFNPKYVLLDSRGNWIRDLNKDELETIEGGTKRELNTHKQLVNPSKEYTNRYYTDFTTNDSETGVRFYYSKSDPDEDVIVELPKIYASNVENKNIVVPKEIAQVLATNTDWVERVFGNAQNFKNFERWISSILQSGLAYSDNAWFGREKRRLKKMGFNDDEVERIRKSIKEARSFGNRGERRSKYTVNKPVQSQKNGGPITKLQFGGISGGSTESRGISERRVNVDGVNPANAAGITEIGGKNWTDADTTDMVALLGDLGSLGLAFIPGANIGSAGVGAVASTARLKADLSRGTKGAGWNYLLNLGMDAATLLPLLGEGAKGAKTVKAIKNTLPTLIKAASVYGLGSAFVNSAKKIANGDKWTVRDVSTVVNGLTAAVGLAKSGGFGRSTKKGTSVTEGMELAGKKTSAVDLSGKKIELSGDEVASIAKLDQAKQAAAMDKLLVDKVKAVSGNSRLSDADALAAIDRTRFDTEVRNWKIGKGFGKKDVEFRLGETTKSGERAPVEANGKWFHDWWHGVGGNRFNYNKQLRGEPLVERRIVIPENTTPGVMDLSVPAVVQEVAASAQSLAVPQFIRVFTDANYQRNKLHQPSYPPMAPLYKKGGKIYKGQESLDTAVVTADLKAVPTFKTTLDVPEPSNATFESNRNAFSKVQERQLNDAIADAYKSGFQGGINADRFNFDLNPALNWGRALYSMHQSDKQLKNWLSRPRYHMQTPLLNAPRFVDSGQGDAYQQAANKTRMSKSVTSDAIANEAAARQRQADALNLEIQAGLARSQEFGQYKQAVDQFNNENTLRLTDIANQNRHFDWQHDIEDVQQKNANIAEKSKFFDQAAYATQDWYSRQHDLASSIRGAEAYTSELATLQSDWNAAVEAVKAKYNGDLSSDAAASELAHLKEVYTARQQNLQTAASRVQLAFPFRAKKGGKVGKDSKVTYSRDPYPELVLANSKSSSKFVEKLNDSTIKLILQTKPLHVS